MAGIFHALVFCFVAAVLLSGGRAHHRDQAATVHDVTEYGAAPGNRDNRAAFLSARRAACDSTSGGHATLLIPKGTFAVGAVEFEGPCVNGGAPAVVIDGVLQPCACAGCRRSDDAWITFRGLNGLLVTGDGTLDGQGDRRSGKSKSSKTTRVYKMHGEVMMDPGGHCAAAAAEPGVGGRDELHGAGAAAGEQPGLPRELPALPRGGGGGPRHPRAGRQPQHGRRPRGAVEPRPHPGLGDRHGRRLRVRGPGSTDVVVSGVVCGPGHGLSVGSLGKDGGEEDVDVVGLVVKNCTVKGTTNGVRIKTWPGSRPSRASNITFQDITVVNVSRPIVIDQRYCPHDHCSDADKPSLVQISDVTFQRIEGTSSSRMAVQLLCSEDRPCTGVRLDGINLTCGDHPCRSQFSNVKGTPASVAALVPIPARDRAPAPCREEEADIAPSAELQGQLTWSPFTVRG